MTISPSIMTTYGRIDIAFTHGEGSYLYSEDGKKYLDYASGIAVNAFGHCHPKLVEALKDQASKLWHTSNLYRIPEQETVAEKLVENSCADRVFFCNSGAEATEGAVKVARRFAWANNEKDRTEIICATGAFHGRTLAMLAANDRPLFREGFGPSAQGFTHVEWGDIESLKNKIGKHVAAILVEPVQGEGGARKAPKGYLKLLQDIANENGSLLISDEVQIGMGRSGTLFAYQQENIDQKVIEKVSKIANLHEFVINELPKQYQTSVGERGIRLSGGQLQRIGIARALYHNPQVLILDEATSALDNDTEQTVMEAINNIKKDTTVILIAHRLNTVKNCDFIFKLDKGRVINQGTPKELFA